MKTRLASLALYDEVLRLNHPAALALMRPVFSFAVLLALARRQRRADQE